MSVAKLILDYESKLLIKDDEIKAINAEIKSIRKGEFSLFTIDECLQDRKLSFAVRQSYVQIIEDLKSI